MGAVRSCVCLLVIFVHLQVIMGKPMFDFFLCDLLCDDEDITAPSSSDEGFMGLVFDCTGCPLPATTPRPAQSIAIMMPATNGLTLNVTDNNGIMQMILNAMAFGGSQTTAAPAATAAPPGNGTAGNATAGR